MASRGMQAIHLALSEHSVAPTVAVRKAQLPRRSVELAWVLERLLVIFESRKPQNGQSVDLSTSYRVIGNVNVTAGVRLSKDNNRLAPLTDGVEDDQAVYVGTRVNF